MQANLVLNDFLSRKKGNLFVNGIMQEVSAEIDMKKAETVIVLSGDGSRTAIIEEGYYIAQHEIRALCKKYNLDVVQPDALSMAMSLYQKHTTLKKSLYAIRRKHTTLKGWLDDIRRKQGIERKLFIRYRNDVEKNKIKKYSRRSRRNQKVAKNIWF